jgi:isopenicillin-N N-acyltransferase like protein
MLYVLCCVTGLEAALDLTTDLTTAYTGRYYYEQMHGMADAAGVSFDKIRRIHMIGELTRGRCSMFGAWGEALADPNGLLSLRALDWDVDGPFKKFPELTVYHAAPGSNENDFINVGTGRPGHCHAHRPPQLN